MMTIILLILTSHTCFIQTKRSAHIKLDFCVPSQAIFFLLEEVDEGDKHACTTGISDIELIMTTCKNGRTLLPRNHFSLKKISKLLDLVVLHPSHFDRSFTEHLTLHVDSVFSDQSHTSFTSSDAASS